MKDVFRPLILFMFCVALSGCGGPAIVLGGEVGGMYLTKRGDGDPPDPNLQIAPHETWCYSTMGDPDCYSAPQDVAPTRLINVDPQHRYPLNTHAYNEELAQAR